MDDISMCGNKECNMRLECYRYMAMPNEYRQSYAEFKQDETGHCDSYLVLHKDQIHLINKYILETKKEYERGKRDGMELAVSIFKNIFSEVSRSGDNGESIAYEYAVQRTEITSRAFARSGLIDGLAPVLTTE